MHGISQKRIKYKAQWTQGIWGGKDTADQDMIIIENEKILKCLLQKAFQDKFGL